MGYKFRLPLSCLPARQGFNFVGPLIHHPATKFAGSIPLVRPMQIHAARFVAAKCLKAEIRLEFGILGGAEGVPNEADR